MDSEVDKLSLLCCHSLYFYVSVSLISNSLQNVLSATGLEEFFLFKSFLLFYLIQYNSLAEFTFLFPVILYLEKIFAVKIRRDSSLQDRGLSTGSPECSILNQI